MPRQHKSTHFIVRPRGEYVYFELHVSEDCSDDRPLRFGKRKAFSLLQAIDGNVNALREELENYIGTYAPR